MVIAEALRTAQSDIRTRSFQVSGNVMALREGELDSAEEVGEVIERLGGDGVDRVEEEVAVVIVVVEAGGLQQQRARSCGGDCVQVLRKLGPCGHAAFSLRRRSVDNALGWQRRTVRAFARMSHSCAKARMKGAPK